MWASLLESLVEKINGETVVKCQVSIKISCAFVQGRLQGRETADGWHGLGNGDDETFRARQPFRQRHWSTFAIRRRRRRRGHLTLYRHVKKPQSNILFVIQQYGDWYTGRWWVGSYIWCSEEGPGRAAAPPSPLLAVPNVTPHASTASVPTSYYSRWYYNCQCRLTR